MPGARAYVKGATVVVTVFVEESDTLKPANVTSVSIIDSRLNGAQTPLPSYVLQNESTGKYRLSFSSRDLDYGTYEITIEAVGAAGVVRIKEPFVITP